MHQNSKRELNFNKTTTNKNEVILKKLSFLLVLAISFIAFEAESIDQPTLENNNNQEVENENPGNDEIDIFFDGDKGLGN